MSLLFCAYEYAFFLERSDRLCAQGHCDFLSVDNESFLLKVGFEDPFRATQREAHIVTELFTFTGEIAACRHFYYFHLLYFYNLYQFTAFLPFCQ